MNRLSTERRGQFISCLGGRFTRLTNVFYKKVENLAHAVSLHYMRFNFARPHQTLTKRVRKPTTPAMAAGKADHVWSVWEIVGLLDWRSYEQVFVRDSMRVVRWCTG